MQPACTVLMWRFSSVGDIVLATPAISALAQAWPHARIIFATKAAFVPLLQANPHLHAVVSAPADASFGVWLNTLRACRADAVVDLHGKARGWALRFGLRTPHQAYWHKRDLADSLTMHLGHGRYRARKHIAARYHQAVEQLVGRALPRATLRYDVAPADEVRARVRLQALRATRSGPCIGLSPGAMWATKRWPLARFVALAQRLVAQGMHVVLTGSPDEMAQAEIITHNIPSVQNLTGRITLGELGGIIAQCDVFVANDSGPMHIARALGVPTVAFFGSTDPNQFDGRGHRLLFSGRACAPCSFHGLAQCPKGHLGCLYDLSVQDAESAIYALLGCKPVAPVIG